MGAHLALAGVPSEAGAAKFRLSRQQIVTAYNAGGVHFAGGEPVLWDGHGGLVRVAADGHTTPVADSRHPSGQDFGLGLVLGSDDYLATENDKSPPELFVGGVDGPLRKVSSCSDQEIRPVLTDQALAFMDDGCDGQKGIKGARSTVGHAPAGRDVHRCHGAARWR